MFINIWASPQTGLNEGLECVGLYLHAPLHVLTSWRFRPGETRFISFFILSFYILLICESSDFVWSTSHLDQPTSAFHLYEHGYRPSVLGWTPSLDAQTFPLIGHYSAIS
jgi:hypothetical protein